jgi:hypothetical protein
MHVCDDFREKITEQLLDRSAVETSVEIRRELLVCNSCADFYRESKTMIEVFAGVDFKVSDTRLELMNDRLREKIYQDSDRRQSRGWRSWFTPHVPAFAGALALLLVSVGLYRFNMSTPPVPPVHNAIGALPADNSDAVLDPVTMEFIEQSELLLRTVMKLKPSSTTDLKEAKQTADRHLVALDQRKQAAYGNEPVVEAMDRYENVLRDICNVDNRSLADDLADIKSRIEKNGLIADMKAFQPKLTPADADLGNEQ